MPPGCGAGSDRDPVVKVAGDGRPIRFFPPLRPVFHLPAILLALALAGWGESQGAGGAASAPCWAAPVALLLLAAWPRLGARLCLAPDRPRLAGLWRRSVEALPLLGQALLCLLLGYPACLERLGLPAGTLLGWPRLEGLLLLLPFVVLSLAAIEAGARYSAAPRAARRSLLRYQLRQLAVGMAALALAILLCAPLWLHRPLRVWIEESSPVGAAWTALLATGFAGLFPLLLWLGLGLKPLPAGPLRSEFEALTQRAGQARLSLRLWPTGGWVANAAIVGFLPGLRLVLFSDGLLFSLGRRELCGVLAHELGHARRRHVLLYTAFTVGFLGAWPGLVFLCERLGQPLSAAGELALLLGLGLLWLLLFGALSRRAELDADLVALELLGASEPLESALLGVSAPAQRRRRSWRHFSPAQRGLFLRAAAADPAVGRRLRAGLRSWKLAALLLLLGSGALAGWAWSAGAAEERLWIELRLGRYGEAAQRAQALGPRAERLRERAELGCELALGLPESSAAWLAAARGELLAGRVEGARGLLELGRLRDLPGLSAALRALGAPAPQGPGAWDWPEGGLPSPRAGP